MRRGRDSPQVWAQPEGEACRNTHLASLPCSVCSNVGCGYQEQRLALKGFRMGLPTRATLVYELFGAEGNGDSRG